MGNTIALISFGTGVVLVALVVIGTVRLVKKTKNYNPDHDLNDIERFFDEDED